MFFELFPSFIVFDFPPFLLVIEFVSYLRFSYASLHVHEATPETLKGLQFVDLVGGNVLLWQEEDFNLPCFRILFGFLTVYKDFVLVVGLISEFFPLFLP